MWEREKNKHFNWVRMNSFIVHSTGGCTSGLMLLYSVKPTAYSVHVPLLHTWPSREKPLLFGSAWGIFMPVERGQRVLHIMLSLQSFCLLRSRKLTCAQPGPHKFSSILTNSPQPWPCSEIMHDVTQQRIPTGALMSGAKSHGVSSLLLVLSDMIRGGFIQSSEDQPRLILGIRVD